MAFLPDLQPNHRRVGFSNRMTEGTQGNLQTTAFQGINIKGDAQDGEFAWMENMSDREYPLLAPRKQRTVVQRGLTYPMDMIGCKDGLAVIHGGFLHYGKPNEIASDSTKIDMKSYIFSETGKTTDFPSAEDEADMDFWYSTPHQLVSMGAYVLAFPQRLFYNTKWQNDEDSGDRWGNIGALSKLECPLHIQICRYDGRSYDTQNPVRSKEPPEQKYNGMLWLDTSSGTDVLKQYSYPSDSWFQVSTVYLKIQNYDPDNYPLNMGLGGNFKRYDTVRITNMDEDTFTIPDYDAQTDGGATWEIVRNQMKQLMEQELIVYDAGDNYIVVAGMLSTAVYCRPKGDKPVLIERRVPAMDYVIEHDNRLWGCHYGLNADGKFVNEIYCSKQGDFRNWYCFMGLSTDSWQTSVGAEGYFTGACVLNGYPTFFKEHCAIRIGGRLPESFTVSTTEIKGVQWGSWRSLRVIDGVAYYKGLDGVYRYDGGQAATLISDKLTHDRVYNDARAGANGRLYYLSMQDVGTKTFHLFVYDTTNGLWHREDNTMALNFASYEYDFFMIPMGDYRTGCDLVECNLREPGDVEKRVEWYTEFALTGYYDASQKYLSRYDIRLKMAVGDWVDLWIRYDDEKEWQHKGRMIGKGTGSFVIPVIPRRCDHCQLKISGRGDVRIWHVKRIYEAGGDPP